MSPCEKFVLSGGFTKASNLGLFLDCILFSMGKGATSSGPGALIGAVFFFIIVHHAYKQAPAVWMWDDNKAPQVPGKFLATQVLADPKPYLAWAKKRGVLHTWIDPISAIVSPTPKAVADLSNFLTLSRKQGLTTQFLFASTGSSDPAGTGSNELDAIFGLLKQIDKKFWPSAVQTNIEGLGGGVDATKQYNAHKAFKAKVDSFNLKNGTQLGLAASVGFWWLKFEAGGDPPKVGGKDYGLALLELGFDVTVQVYRKPEWTIKPAEKWSDVAGDFGRQAWIGLLVGPKETGSYDYSDKIEALGGAFADVVDACINKPGFAGVAAHDTYYWQKAAP
ncbi:MAG: hypothetical protein AMXMBFR64_22240 [Myxococcales bacterium]